MSKTVDNIRQKIDALDNKLHDLLMERAELVLKIGEEKRKQNIQVVQPDREAVMLRRLLDRHEGPLPREAIVRIWRELVGAVSLLQTGLKVVVTVPEDHTGLIYWDMAKDYFSSVLPMQKVSNALTALSMVREGEATFAVMPWPEDGDENPWWRYMMGESGDQAMRITGRVPFGDRNENDPNPEFRGLIVARARYETSGDDRSFLALQLPGGVSRAKLLDVCRGFDLEPRGVYSKSSPTEPESLHLVELDRFVAIGSDQIGKIMDKLEAADGIGTCLGGYPTPPVYNDSVGKNALSMQANSDSKKKTA